MTITQEKLILLKLAKQSILFFIAFYMHNAAQRTLQEQSNKCSKIINLEKYNHSTITQRKYMRNKFKEYIRNKYEWKRWQFVIKSNKLWEMWCHF